MYSFFRNDFSIHIQINVPIAVFLNQLKSLQALQYTPDDTPIGFAEDAWRSSSPFAAAVHFRESANTSAGANVQMSGHGC